MSGELLREALAEVLAGLPVRPDRCGAVDIQGAESLADALLPAVLRYGRETAAAAVVRLKAIPTYELSNDGEPLGVVVLADDVLDALTADPT